jgi:4'-phosphopantetheinyl transferase
VTSSDFSPLLGADDLVVFRVDLVPGAWARFLTPEQLRFVMERMPTDAARRETISCEGALRLILGRLLDVEPRDVEVKRTAKGKPYIEGDIGFSLTHTRDLGLIAVARRQRVGVDIESADRYVDCDAVADGFFPPKERGEILATPFGRRVDVLLHAFTRFESAVKATGAGLTIPSDPFDQLVDGMHWRHVDVGRSWIACVTADGPEWRARVRNARDLLEIGHRVRASDTATRTADPSAIDS